MGGRAEQEFPPPAFPSPLLPLSLFPGVSVGHFLKGDTTRKTQPFLPSLYVSTPAPSLPQKAILPPYNQQKNPSVVTNAGNTGPLGSRPDLVV